MNNKQLEATLRLFKSFVVPKEKTTIYPTEVQMELRKRSAEKGLFFTSYLNLDTYVLDEAIKQYGKDGDKWNQTFHKSFQTVLDTPIETLVAQQIIHYFTTYGLEALDLYNQDLVYIPHEQLDVPELQEDIPVIIIHEISEQDLTNKLMTLLTSGIALSKQTVEDVMTLSDYINLDLVEDIKNREVKIAMFNKYNIVPGNNLEFFRWFITKITGSTLLIKNDSMIKAIQEADNTEIYTQLRGYVLLQGYYTGRFYKNKPEGSDLQLTNGYEVLAKIFLRYKDLFLALKRKDLRTKYAKEINKMVNRISKLSKTHHEPMDISTLDRLTSLTDEVIFDMAKDSILKDLDNVTIFREMRILNALAIRIKGTESLVYRIRNGKTFVEENANMTDRQKLNLKTVYNTIYKHLTNRISVLLKDKKVYIPELFNYAAPTSEKQFVGNIPEGSYVEIPRNKNMVVGIHWTNTTSRVDLDMHAQNKTQQIGWNTSYYSNERDLVFSGDVTDAPAPKGATELFLIKEGLEDKQFLITVNKYSGPTGVPFEFVVSEFDDDNISKNYVLDANKIKVTLPFEFASDDPTGNASNQMTLGLVDISKNYIRFYFNKFELGKSIVTRRNSINTGAFNYMNDYKEVQLRLNDILKDAGVELLDKPVYEKLEEVTIKNENGEEETLYRKVETRADYDLSYEAIDKETLIKLFSEV